MLQQYPQMDTTLKQKTQGKTVVSKTLFSGLTMLQSCDLSLGNFMAESSCTKPAEIAPLQHCRKMQESIWCLEEQHTMGTE